jgi:glucuronosyltransferase
MDANDQLQQHFDLIVVDGVLNECVLPLVHRFQAPLIYMNGFQASPWLLDAVGAPLASDHYPNPAFSFPQQMNLWQRTLNLLSNVFIVYYRNWFIMSTVDGIYDRHLQHETVPNNRSSLSLPSMPSVRDIEQRHLSLVITNTHLSLNYQHPKVAAMIEAGALHCRPSKPLPNELEDYVANSGDAGFIIVSFGSILRGANLPESVRRLFLAVFARLDQRIIWKWEEQLLPTNDTAASIPANVKLVSWLPQQDLLGHAKCRLFITHCGLLSQQESVYHSVPFIALPVFADQPLNAQKAQDDGYAIRLDWDTLSEQGLYNAIQKILTDGTYGDNVRKTSQLMRDQNERPLDRAVYWIEYVLRHRGAQHLHSPSRQMFLYERSLIDVALFLMLVCIAGVYLISATVVAIKSFFFSRLIKAVASITQHRRMGVANLKNKKKKNL